MSISMDRYKFYVDEKHFTVIAVSSYAGKTVKGRAKCDPRDGFDLEKGKELAAARCNKKVAEKRAARARKKLTEAQDAIRVAQAYCAQMEEYFNDATEDASEAAIQVLDLLQRY